MIDAYYEGNLNSDLLKEIDYYGQTTGSLKNPSLQSCPIIYEFYYNSACGL